MKGQGYKYNLGLIHINQNIVVQRILKYYDATSNAKTISTHFGFVKHQDIHVVCGGGGEADDKWGHFHRNGVNTGVYVFGDTCTP